MIFIISSEDGFETKMTEELILYLQRLRFKTINVKIPDEFMVKLW